MSEHTPTPWKATYTKEGYAKAIESVADRKHIPGGIHWITRQNAISGPSGKEGKANAAFIVKACNNHDALVELVHDMVATEIEYMIRNSLGDPENQHNVKRARALFAQLEKTP